MSPKAGRPRTQASPSARPGLEGADAAVAALGDNREADPMSSPPQGPRGYAIGESRASIGEPLHGRAKPFGPSSPRSASSERRATPAASALAGGVHRPGRGRWERLWLAVSRVFAHAGAGELSSSACTHPQREAVAYATGSGCTARVSAGVGPSGRWWRCSKTVAPSRLRSQRTCIGIEAR